MENPPKILIADDDPFIAEMYTLKFRELGFDVDVATDGKMAIEKVEHTHPDVLLLDVVMPVIDGFEVLQELKKDDRAGKTKIILLTNLGQKEDVEKGTRLGADDYIIKAHFTPSEVAEKIKLILQQ